MKDCFITIIGAGHMGSALAIGLLANHFSPEKICLADPDEKKLRDLKNQYSLQITTNNLQAAKKADVLILAVKPQHMAEMIKPLISVIKMQQPLILSIAAGIRTTTLFQWLGETIPLVRCMPNMPALIRASATALYATNAVTPEQHQLAETLMRSVGTVCWLQEESLLDAVTALSGSGPAYFLLIMDALTKAGAQIGLPKDIALALTLQTALGTARLAIEQVQANSTKTHETLLENLIHSITSPGGTTEAALKILRAHGVTTQFIEAVDAAKQRAQTLGEK